MEPKSDTAHVVKILGPVRPEAAESYLLQLLKGHSSKMTPKSTLLCQQISVSPSQHQRSSLLQQMGTNTGTHSLAMCTVERNLEPLSPKLNVSLKSLPSGCREPCRSRGWKIVRARRKREHQRSKNFRTQQAWCTSELTETPAAYVGPSQIWACWRNSHHQ